MKRARVGVLIVVLTVGITVLASIVLAGTTYNRYYGVTDHGVEYQGTVPTSNDNGNQYRSLVCRANCQEVGCNFCHANSTDRSKEIYTASKHEKIYFPRFAVIPREGDKVAFGSYGGYLVFKNKQFAYFLKDGKLNMIAPSGSLLLKDRRGVPFLLEMPTDPVLK